MTLVVACGLRLFCACCSIAASSLMCATADGDVSNVVDVYNSATGAWSTATLSGARAFLAAASVGNVALFAGGWIGSALLCRDSVERFLLLHACRVFFVCAAVLRFCLPCDRFLLPLSCAPLQMVLL
jgi:hypothetical protein